MCPASSQTDPGSASYQITAIPAFNDNYLWLLHDKQFAVIVDPGDAAPVQSILEEKGLMLQGIVITHHHADHIGGIGKLLKKYPVPVIGPDDKRIPEITHRVSEGDRIDMLGLQAEVIAVPGHTLHHINYFIPMPNPLGSPVLFAGDTLFAGGCGGSLKAVWRRCETPCPS